MLAIVETVILMMRFYLQLDAIGCPCCRSQPSLPSALALHQAQYTLAPLQGDLASKMMVPVMKQR
ncbi:hypothetical protein D1872_353270 [compost metagenome]